jgi:hypothetical protein
MKQAILITAYKDIPALVDVIRCFGAEFNFYIHVDRSKSLEVELLSEFDNVQVFNDYKVKWAGVNHLRAILLLSSEALKNTENTFFHLITGEDFPIKSKSEFLLLDQSKNYLENFKLPNNSWAGNGGLDRVDYYNLYDLFDAKKRWSSIIIGLALRLQKKLKLRRSPPRIFNGALYGGSTYWSLNRGALEYVLRYTHSDPSFLRRLRYTFCAEEMYFQTILMNSEWNSTICNDNLRYIDWSSGRGGYPAFLDTTDLEQLLSSKKYFARKIKHSDQLKELLLINYNK